MIVIAGISPKIKTLESTPRLCSRCGLAQAYLKRVDHYFTFFFIPLFPVKKGQPILVCNKCERNGVQFSVSDVAADPKPMEKSCPYCGKPSETDFIYCPYCGKPLNQ